MRRGLVDIRDLATNRVAEAFVGDFCPRTRVAGIRFRKTAFGVRHGRTVYGCRVVDEIFFGRDRSVAAGGIGDASLAVKSVVREANGVSDSVDAFQQIAGGSRSAGGVAVICVFSS